MAFPITVDGNYIGGPLPGRVGPFIKNSTTRYLVFHGPSPAYDNDPHLGMFKSSDNGQTWTLMDDINSPPFVSSTSLNACSACQDAGTKIWVIYLVANVITAVSFDFGTDLWGTPITSSITVSSPSNITAITSAFRSLDSVVAFLTVNGSTPVGINTCSTTQFYTFNPSGSTFSSPTTLSNINLGAIDQVVFPKRMVEGTSGVMHCAIEQDGATSGADCTLMFQSVNSSGTAGTLQSIATSNGVFLYTPLVDLVYQGGSITLGYAIYDNGGPLVDDRITLIQGTSALNVTFAALTTVISTDSLISSGGLALANFTTTIDAFYVGDGPSTLDFFVASALGASTLIGLANFNNNTLQAAMFSASSYGLTWDNLYWEATLSSGFTATCPTTGAFINTPYSHFITVIGGVGPFTFALTNGGGLPTGISLNTTTGEVHGTPTVAGSNPWQVTITDTSSGDTFVLNCNITVVDLPPPVRPARFCTGQA